MGDTRRKDGNWIVTDDSEGMRGLTTWSQVQLAVLMDLRDELKSINRRLNCSETLGIPRTLRAIQRNTTKRKYKCRKCPKEK